MKVILALAMALGASAFSGLPSATRRTARRSVSMKVDGLIGATAPLGYFDPCVQPARAAQRRVAAARVAAPLTAPPRARTASACPRASRWRRCSSSARPS